MLNLRCLGIVFDLDETLIVANTLRSFENKMEALWRKLNSDSDPRRVSAMLAEIKRYQDDKLLLKQYAENDQVFENGKVIKSQPEVIRAPSGTHQPIVRPIVRLQDKNIILTRINPLIRDTSVLVRLRPAWEDLRSYLTVRGRKRFEVFVCTMAERDYALEMWRLLDPESKLISTKEMLNRIVCVKPGLKKSLFNVFQIGKCHPSLALVIDDRLDVWDEKDQPRVHVVPAFAQYYAPQAEANISVPVLCVARNVACNVRGGFFKDFDEGILQQILQVKYEDDVTDSPSPPDVSNYLIWEDDTSALNGNKDSLSFNGVADINVGRRLEATSIHATVNQVGLSKTRIQNSPDIEEREVLESDLDPDTRRRLLSLHHRQDIRGPPIEPKFPIRPPLQVSVPQVERRGKWCPVEEEMSSRQLNPPLPVPPKGFSLQPELPPVDRQQPHRLSFVSKVDNSSPSDIVFINGGPMIPKEALHREKRLRPNPMSSAYPPSSDNNKR